MRATRRLSRVLALVLLTGATAACTTTGGGYFTPTVSADAAPITLDMVNDQRDAD